MSEYNTDEKVNNLQTALDRIAALEDQLNTKNKEPKPPSKRKMLTLICDEVDVIRSTNGLVYAFTDGYTYPVMLLSDEGEELIRVVGRDKLKFELMHSEITEITKSLQSKATRSTRIPIEPRVIYDPIKNMMYHDLCNDEYTCVHINSVEPSVDSIIVNPMFHRTPTTQALPNPDFKGTFADLEEGFAFIKSDKTRHLIIGYLAHMFSPFKERMPLYIYGDTQSGKSAVCKMISFLVDPRTREYSNSEFSFTKRIRDLMATAVDQYAIVFGNEDNMESELANELCKRATGGATVECKLYRQGVSFQIEAIRSVIINALHPPSIRPDLLKRFLVIQLTKISKDVWLEPSVAEAEFMARRPKMMGALYNAIRTGLSRWRTTTGYPDMERHSELCRWIKAISPEWDWTDDYFATILKEHEEHTLDNAASILELSEALKAVLRNKARVELSKGKEPKPDNEAFECTYGEMVEYIEWLAPWYKTSGRLNYKSLSNDLNDYQEQLARGGVMFVRNVKRVHGSYIHLFKYIDNEDDRQNMVLPDE